MERNAPESNTQETVINISGEKRAIQWLRNNEDLVIRVADKGGATVVWGKEQYIHEALRQLSDQHYYAPLQSNPITSITNELKNMLDDALKSNWITTNELNFLLPKEPRLATFYLLPKIHKCLNTPPGRPIISGIDSITEPVSKYIDFFIKPLTSSLKAYLQDTTDVLKKLEEIRKVDNAFLVTMDVEALYTNIAHEEGLEALRYFLQQRPNTNSPPTDFLVDLTNWTLRNNIFLFQDKLYRQIKGTAMGAAYAPNYAGLYLGLWEERYIYSHTNPFKHRIKYYGRYIDDLCFLFSGPEDELVAFHQYLNSTNPNIRLSLEYSATKINFLDLTISIDTEGQDFFLKHKESLEERKPRPSSLGAGEVQIPELGR
ncbi:uncharacterized protein LOC134456700 [Engraulis encrasicolus]|uniref:uncharacterized protein LOC134456700 n=1 Tax=Engraulis encrasicolus TaxID=184585 RepID=UPI002FD102F3